MLDWLLDALRAHFGPLVAPLWESRGFWRGATLGLVVLVVAVAILLVKQRHRITAFLRRDEQRQHDRAIFGESDKLLPEAALMNTLRTLSGQHAYTTDQLQKVTSFGYYFEETGHHYLDKSIGDATRRLPQAQRSSGFHGTVLHRVWDSARRSAGRGSVCSRA